MGYKTDTGVRNYPAALAAASLAYVPLFDRSARLRNLYLDNVSADDNWTVTVGGREVMRFRMLTSGNQRLLLSPPLVQAWQPTFFDWARIALGYEAGIPIPQGLQCVVASVGGATADIIFEVEEHDGADFNGVSTNHYRGSDFLMPIYGRLNAGQVAPGAFTLDTQDAPAWVPNIFGGAAIPPGWAIDILALFTEGMGVNTFSGAANHQSISQDLRFVRNGESLFVHPNTAGSPYLPGMPDVGSASAAGSANTVFGQRSGVFNPFLQSEDDKTNVLDYPIPLRPGDNLVVQLDITGDLTGTASYARALQVLVCRITAAGGLGS